MFLLELAKNQGQGGELIKKHTAETEREKATSQLTKVGERVRKKV